MSLIKILSKETFEDVKLINKLKADYTPDTSTQVIEEFEAACQNFRQVCAEIQQAIGVEDFKGGFDEMLVFQNSPIAQTTEGLALAMRWSAANSLCTYIADRKLKIGQPAWWKRCWGIET